MGDHRLGLVGREVILALGHVVAHKNVGAVSLLLLVHLLDGLAG